MAMADNGLPPMADNGFPPIRQRKSKSDWRRWKNCWARTSVALAVLIGLIFLLGMIYFMRKFDLIDIEGPSVESVSGSGNLKEAQIDSNAVCTANFAAKSTEFGVDLTESEPHIDSNAVCAANFTAKSTEFGVDLTESEPQIDSNAVCAANFAAKSTEFRVQIDSNAVCAANLTEPTDIEGPIDREVWNAIDKRFEKMSEEMINRLNVLEEKHQLFEKGVDHLNSMLDERHRLFEKALGQLNEEWSKSNLKLDEIGALVRQRMEHGHKSESPEPEPKPEPAQPNLDGLSNTVMKVITVISIMFALRMLFIICTE